MIEKSTKIMPQYIIPLSMLYIVSFVFPIMLAYRMVQLGDFLLPGGTIFFASSYFFSDIVSEVYGYQVSRQLVWAGLTIQIILATCIQGVLLLPAPHEWHDEPLYQYVFGHSLRYALAATIGNFASEFLNIFANSKFKILWHGKYFWIRSITSTFFGEAVLTVIVFFITFIGVESTDNILHLIISGYIYKMIFAAIMAYPAQIIAGHLKKVEKLDVYDLSTNFNPFKFKISQPIFNKYEPSK